MTLNPLDSILAWARSRLGQPIMFEYLLNKVNGQTPGSVFLLLRQPDSLRSTVEIEVVYFPNRTLPYHATFTQLPFSTNRLPRPNLLQVDLGSEPELIHWLKTGQKRSQFSDDGMA